jgi:hypothetical protein
MNNHLDPKTLGTNFFDSMANEEAEVLYPKRSDAD